MQLPTTAALLTACLLLAAVVRATSAAGGEQWRSQIVYFLLTDRFAPAPGATPAPCQLMDWNNGTWSGITANLDLIQDLGMTAVWITPIPKQYQGKSWGHSGYHGYWAQDWSRVEPHYGTEQDLKDLVRTAHDRGMLMMLDVVANHAGPITNLSSITPFNESHHYHGCAGCTQHCAIPQQAYAGAEAWPPRQPDVDLVKTCRLVDLLDLDQSNPFVRTALIRWMQDTLAQFGFDAIRMDTVKHVDTPFWTDFTNAVGVFSMGEVLNGNTRALVEYVQKGPDGRQPMQSVLNFPIYYKLTNVFAYKQDMRQLSNELRLQRELLGRDVTPLLGNFLEGHDFPRFLTLQPDVALFKNALTWLLLAEGIPIVYYGAAAGMAGGTEGNANRACLWQQPYDKESELFKLIATLSKLRTSRQLWNVSERAESVTADCYAYTVGPDALVVTTSRGSSSKVVHDACEVVLEEGSALMRTGLAGMQDVLDFKQRAGNEPTGVSWDPAARRLSIEMPGGNPRVLTGTRFKLSYLSEGHAGDEVKEIGAAAGQQTKQAEEVQVNWGRAPQVASAAAGRRSHVVVLTALAAVAALL